MSERTENRDLVTLPVEEVMSRPVFSVTADALLGDTLALLVRTGRRHLAVVDDGWVESDAPVPVEIAEG